MPPDTVESLGSELGSASGGEVEEGGAAAFSFSPVVPFACLLLEKRVASAFENDASVDAEKNDERLAVGAAAVPVDDS